ncbi:hypothetical protein D9M68_918360 [compost metagenome]
MVRLSHYAAKRLAQAKRFAFGRPVTAYLTDARIIACAGFGVTHGHVKADLTGRFGDGHRIRTSDVRRTEQIGPFWVLHTASGSLYVIITFDKAGGRRSLDTFRSFSRAALLPTPSHLQ